MKTWGTKRTRHAANNSGCLNPFVKHMIHVFLIVGYIYINKKPRAKFFRPTIYGTAHSHIYKFTHRDPKLEPRTHAHVQIPFSICRVPLLRTKNSHDNTHLPEYVNKYTINNFVNNIFFFQLFWRYNRTAEISDWKSQRRLKLAKFSHNTKNNKKHDIKYTL